MPFQDAYERILQSTGLRTQTDIAAMLGVKQSSISEAKRRNHIPDSWILERFPLNKKGLDPSGSAPEKARSMWRGTDTPPTPVLSEQQAAESLEPMGFKGGPARRGSRACRPAQAKDRTHDLRRASHGTVMDDAEIMGTR